MRLRVRTLAAEDLVLLAAMFLLPWAFGGVESWAWRPAAGLVGVAAGIALARRGPAGLGLTAGSRWLLPLALIVLWVFVQSVPMPGPVVRAVSPAAGAIWAETTSDLEAAALGHLPPNLPPAPPALSSTPSLDAHRTSWPTLSLSPPRTREGAVWFAAMALAMLLARKRTSESEVAAFYRAAWFTLAAVLALQGFLQMAAGSGKLLGLRAIGSGRPFGPFVNGTNFTALMEIAVPWLIGYAAMRWRRKQRFDPRMAAGLAVAVLATAAGFASQSRTGSILLVIAITVTMATVARGGRERAIVLFGAGVTIALAFIGVSMSPIGARFRYALATGEYFDPDRIAVWKAIVRMIGDFPVAGIGVGAFGHAFRRYVPAGGSEAWWQAHNDWLEWIAVTGIVGAVLLAWFLFGYGREVTRRLRRPRKTGDREVLAGLVIGLGSVLVHALVEFNLQIPGVALPFAVAAGCAVSARSHPS